MSGLPRELLKWMQSLDLSYSVKNVKRDFSNGFLIAEILSRYYKSDIQMHSFDNGIGLVKRLQNWALLEKFFKKAQFPIERTLIDAVIHCKAGASIPLMEQLYTLLTHKTIQASRPVKDLENIPAFARPTASQLIKERMSEADLANSDVLDSTLAPGKAAKVLAEHNQRLKMERESDPTRFQPKNTSIGKKGGAGTIQGAPVQFKEIQVRQIDDRQEVMQMRANHVYHQSGLPSSSFSQQQQQQQQPQQQTQSSTQQQQSSSSLNNDSLSSSPQPLQSSTLASSSSASLVSDASRPVLSTLSQTLESILQTLNPEFAAKILTLQQQHNGKELCLIYAEQVLSALPDDQNASIIHGLHSNTLSVLVESCLNNPKQFWLLSNWLFQLLTKFKYDSQSFYQAVSFFSGIGLGLVHRDSFISHELFHDFAFARFVALLKEQPNKIFQAAKIAYTFSRDEGKEHAKILSAIKEKLQEGNGGANNANREIHQRIWYSILSALAPFENGLLLSDNAALLHDYLTYADEGVLTGESNRARAVALSILAPLGANPSYGQEVLQPILDRLRPLLQELEEFESEQVQANAAEQEEAMRNGDGEQIIGAKPRVSKRGMENDEWLIDAELLHVLSCVLNHSWITSTPTVLNEILNHIQLILHPQAPYPTILAGLSHLTHVLGSQPGVRQNWMDALLNNEEIRRKILNDTEENYASITSSSSQGSTDLVDLFCPKLRAVWHPLTIAQTLADIVRINRLDNLTQGHIELFSAIVSDAFGNQQHPTPFIDSESSEWNRLFLNLRDHLMVELCDSDLSEMVIGILRRFLFDARTTVTAQSIFLPNPMSDNSDETAPPPLYCIMRFMYPDAAEESQMNLAGFLEELSSMETFQNLVYKNLQVFAENENEKFQDSPLVSLLQKLDQQQQQQQ